MKKKKKKEMLQGGIVTLERVEKDGKRIRDSDGVG